MWISKVCSCFLFMAIVQESLTELHIKKAPFMLFKLRDMDARKLSKTQEKFIPSKEIYRRTDRTSPANSISPYYFNQVEPPKPQQPSPVRGDTYTRKEPTTTRSPTLKTYSPTQGRLLQYKVPIDSPYKQPSSLYASEFSDTFSPIREHPTSEFSDTFSPIRERPTSEFSDIFSPIRERPTSEFSDTFSPIRERPTSEFSDTFSPIRERPTSEFSDKFSRPSKRPTSEFSDTFSPIRERPTSKYSDSLFQLSNLPTSSEFSDIFPQLIERPTSSEFSHTFRQQRKRPTPSSYRAPSYRDQQRSPSPRNRFPQKTLKESDELPRDTRRSTISRYIDGYPAFGYFDLDTAKLSSREWN